MRSDRKRVVIVPCSGIGKSFGSVSREAAYDLCDDLRPKTTQLVALSKLVMGEEEARSRVRDNPSITIDGCKLMCAAKMVRHSGGNTLREVAVLDVFRQHKDLKPDGIADLNEEGRQLARILAEDVIKTVDDEVRPTKSRKGKPDV